VSLLVQHQGQPCALEASVAGDEESHGVSLFTPPRLPG